MGEQDKADLRLDLNNLEETLKKLKPEDRSELARYFAIAITDFEKLKAFIKEYILQ